MASKPALCPPDTTSFRNGAGANSASGSSSSQGGRPRRSTGTSGTAAAISSGGRASGSLPTNCQKADDPVLVWEILIPEAAHVGQECPRGWMVLAQRECAWLQQRQR